MWQVATGWGEVKSRSCVWIIESLTRSPAGRPSIAAIVGCGRPFAGTPIIRSGGCRALTGLVLLNGHILAWQEDPGHRRRRFYRFVRRGEPSAQARSPTRIDRCAAFEDV